MEICPIRHARSKGVLPQAQLMSSLKCDDSKTERREVYSVARSVNTIEPEMREILIFTLCPGFAFATYIM